MAGFARFGAGGRRRSDADVEPRLPQGAEAALWSILEAVPDPRNHLAMTRDLSGEVHITDLDRALALAARPDEPTGERTDATEDEQPVVDVREMVDPYYDLGTIAENPHLTDHLFTTSEG